MSIYAYGICAYFKSWAFPMRPVSAHLAPLRRIQAIVAFLNPQPPLSLVGGNRSSCPLAALACARGRFVKAHFGFATLSSRFMWSTSPIKRRRSDAGEDEVEKDAYLGGRQMP